MLQDKVIAITGAGSGIGRATAFSLATQGALLVLADLDAKTLAATASALVNEGARVETVSGDVSSAGFAEQLVGCAVESFGRLDGAFNNAGIETALAPIAAASEADWDATISVNLKAVWLGMRAQLQVMEQQGYGAIVNTASVGGLLAVPGNAAYAAAKHGVIGLTKTAAVEYARKGIRVNCVCPGFTKTAMTERLMASDPGLAVALMPPFARMASADEIGPTVAFLLSDAASYVSGHAMVVDGAATAV